MSLSQESLLPVLNPESTVESYFEALNAQKQSAKKHLNEEVHFHTGELTEAFEFAREAQADVGHIDGVLADSGALLSDHPESLRLLEVTGEERKRLRETIARNDVLGQIIGLLHSIGQGFGEVDSHFGAGRFAAALQALASVEGDMQNLPNFGHHTMETEQTEAKNSAPAHPPGPAIFQIIKGEYRKRKQLFRRQWEGIYTRALVVDEATHTLQLTLRDIGPSHGELGGVLVGLARLHSLHEYFPHTAKKIAGLIGIISSEAFPEVTVVEEPHGEHSHWLRILAPTDPPPLPSPHDHRLAIAGAREQTKHLLGNLEILFRFLKTHLVDQVVKMDPLVAKEVMLQLERHLVAQTNHFVVQNCLAKFIPAVSAQLAEYQSLVQDALAFELQLKELGFGVAGGAELELSKFVKNVDVHFATKKRREILAEVRDLIIKDDHNAVTVEMPPGSINLGAIDLPGIESRVDIPTVLAFPKCKCRQSAVTIVQRAHELLRDATHQTLTSAESLYESVRDVLDLFRALAPAVHGPKFETTLLGVLFHNDCMYIAHNLMLLGPMYKSKLPTPLNKKVTFMDMVMPFRRLGEDYFITQLKKQHQEVIDSITRMNGIDNTQVASRYKAVELAFKQVQHRMKHLQLWQDVLPQGVYGQAVGSIIEHVVSGLIEKTQAVKDFSEEETHRLHALFSSLFELENSFDKNVAQMAGFVPSWLKFKKLTQILEMPMVKIVEMYNARDMTEFTVGEIRALIIALFSDSDRRRFNLAQLR